MGRTKVVLTQNSNISYDKVYLKVVMGSNNGSEEIVYSSNVPVTSTYSFDSSVIHDDINKVVTISPNVTVSELVNKVNNATCSVVNANNNEIASTNKLATNYTLVIVNNGNTYRYGITVLGDVNGDGKVSVSDAVLIAKHSVKGNILNGNIFIKAADTNKDNKISVSDAVITAKYSVKGVGL